MIGRSTAVLALLGVFLPLASPTAGAGAVPPVVRGAEDEVERVLAKVREGDLRAMWPRALDLADLGEEVIVELRTRAANAQPLERLAIARAQLDLEEVPDARDNLFAVAREESAADDVRRAAVQLLGGSAFLEDQEAVEFLRHDLDRTFEPKLQLELAKSLYRISAKDMSHCAAMMEDWLHVERRDLQVMGALALASIGKTEKAARVLREISLDPTPEGELAAAYLQIEDLLRNLQRLTTAPPPRPDDPETELFREVMELALDNHLQGTEYEESDGLRELTAAAANGVLSRLDPHSTFFTNDQHIEWNLDLLRDYGGIGAYVDILGGVFTITRPFHGGPAYRLGLRSGDQIVEVDGWSTEGVSDMQEIIRRLKGEPGTKIPAKIMRAGWAEPREMLLERERIVIPSVNYEMFPGKIGYIEVMTFAGETVQELVAALEELRSQGMRGLILDLRYNSGGFLNAAVDLVGLFCGGNHVAVTTKGRNRFRDDSELRTRPIDSPYADAASLPMAVLINAYSASASEILTGNLRHHGRARVIGEHSYGKGSVQSQFELESEPPERYTDQNLNGIYDSGEEFTDENGNGTYDPGPFVKLTTARYYLPDGTSINREYDRDGRMTHRGGIAPDLRVEATDRLAGKNLDVLPLLDRRDENDRNAFEQYLEDHYDDQRALFVRLAEGDGFDHGSYPEFDSFYASLETPLSQDDVRYLLRIHLRRRVTDDMVRGKSFPFAGNWVLGDYQEDRQLQAALQEVLGSLGEQPAAYEAYAFFDGVDLRAPEEEGDGGAAR